MTAKRILYATFGNPLTEIGGIERYLLTLMVNLKSTVDSEIELFVAFPIFLGCDTNTEGDSKSLFVPVPIKMSIPKNKWFLPLSKMIFNLFLAIYIIKHKNDYDILHIHGDNGTFAFRFFNNKKIFSLHGNSVVYYKTIKERLKILEKMSLFLATSISGLIERYGVTHSDTTFSDQEDVIKYFKKITRKDNIVYLPNFVDTTFFTSAGDRSVVKEELRLNPERQYALWVGTSILRKRLDLAVKSINKCHDINLVIVGPKTYNGEKIVNCGFIEDKAKLAKIYQACEVLLITSAHEGQSIALLESIASGCVPIIRNYLAIPGFVNGYNCFLADNDDSFAKILNIIEKEPNLLSNMSKNARKLACDSYSTERGISEIRKFYRI